MIAASMVDAAISAAGEDADAITEALIALVEEHDAWDWEGDETQPGARVAVVESSDACWAVGIQDLPGRRGWRVSKRCATRLEAGGVVDAWCGA